MTKFQIPNVWLLVLGIWCLFGAWVFPQTSLAAGKALYEQHCARCHGLDGAGKGPDAKRLFPAPRDLTSGIYKFRSTESGTPPQDEDLAQTIAQGLPGTAMPAFDTLTDAELGQVVAYLKTLAPLFQGEPPRPVTITEDPGAAADRSKGKRLYTELGCAACHGNQGRGNGPSASTLVDNWGNPIRATDLTQGWTYRAGASPRSILMRALTGLDGAPMPSYAEAVSAEEAWHLAYYVHSLQEVPNWGATIRVVSTTILPETVEDPVWQTIEHTEVSLGSLLYRQAALVPTTVKAVSIQAMRDEDTIVMRLVWDDPTENRTSPPDAIGIVLVPEGLGEMGSLSTWPFPGAPPLDVIFWSAEGEQIREDLSVGFAPMATGEIAGVALVGEVRYEDGQWNLFIRRPLSGDQVAGLTTFSVDQPVPLAIAIWDGGNGEQQRHHASSAWIDLVLP